MCPWLALSIHVPLFPTMPAGRRDANQKAQRTTVHWAGPRALQRPMRIQSCYATFGLELSCSLLVIIFIPNSRIIKPTIAFITFITISVKNTLIILPITANKLKNVIVDIIQPILN
jgi:hypothetical protein